MLLLHALSALALLTQVPQVQSSSTDGLRIVQATTVAGSVTVYLPADIMAGDTISGTVVAVPSGKTEEERQKNLSILEGTVISTPGGTASPKTPSFTWQFPQALSAARFSLDFLGPKGSSQGQSSLPLATQAPTRALFHFPELAQAGKPLSVSGPFDGVAANTDVSIGKDQVGVIAESPRAAISICPPTIVGPVSVGVTDGGESCGGTCRIIQLKLLADKTTLLRGEKATVKIEVSGLQGLEEPIPITLENRTPEIVTLEGGTARTLPIQPSNVNPQGICNLQVDLTSRNPGTFILAVTVPGQNGSPTLISADVPPGFVPIPGKPDGVQGDGTNLDGKTTVPPQGFDPQPKDKPQFPREPNNTSKWQKWDKPYKLDLEGLTAWLQRFYVVSFVRNGKTYRGGSFRVHFKNTRLECDGGKWRQIIRSTVWVGDDDQHLQRADLVDGRYVPAKPPSTGVGKWDIDTNDAGRTAKNPDYPHQDKGEMVDRPQRAKEATAHYTTDKAPRKKARVVVEEVEFYTFFIKDGNICQMFKWGFKVKWVFRDGDDPTDPESMNYATVTTEFSDPSPCAKGSDDYGAGESALKEAMDRFPK